MKTAVKTIGVGTLYLFLLLVNAFATSDTVTVYEVDGASQTGRPITHGRVFQKGEIPSGYCPRPYVSAVALSSSNYQADVKNTWDDGSVRFALVSYQNLAGLTAGGNVVVTFQADNAVGCNNSGGLTWTQMKTTGFNSGNWGGQIVVTPGSASASAAAVTIDAKTMLADNDPTVNSFESCLNRTWQTGPVVTTVILQDCTSASKWNVGWNWNGVNMASDGVNPSYTGSNTKASLHPIFILHFYPNISAVDVEVILENGMVNRMQDQNIAVAIKTGNPATQVYSKATYTMAARQRWHKEFWTGGNASPYTFTPTFWIGHVRIDHNFPYLIQTKAFPNYDLTKTVSTSTNNATDDETSYATWAGGDLGDINGTGGLYGMPQDYSSNTEGKLLQREDLLYLYNMGSCGTVNGQCAKAWTMLTGEVDANASNTLVGCTGGCGTWNNLANVPYHYRDDRSGTFYYSSYDSKDAIPTTSATGGSGTALGKMLSRHAHIADQVGTTSFPVATVGSHNNPPNGWDYADCSHTLNYSYTPAILTGSYFYVEEQYYAASYCIDSVNPGIYSYQGNGFYGFINPSQAVIRSLAWGLQEIERAAFVAPDSTPEYSYYLSQYKSNLEILEGMLGLTGTSLTPSTSQCSFGSCSAGQYNMNTANRWDFGRYSVVSGCLNTGSGTCTNIPSALHMAVDPAQCPVTGDPLTILNTINFTLSGGSGASPYAVSSGGVIQNTVTIPSGGGGSGYPNSPTCAVNSDVGSGATCTATAVAGAVTAVTITNGGSGYPANATSSFWQEWQRNYLAVVLGEVGRRCLSGTCYARNAAIDQLNRNAEFTLDSTGNPFLQVTYAMGVKDATGAKACNPLTSIDGNSFFTTYAGLKSTIISTQQNSTTFDTSTMASNFACTNHGYSTIGRAAAMYTPYYNISSSDANCSGGQCTAADTVTWWNAHAPYFNNSPTGSTGCGAVDYQIPFALAQISVSSCALSPSSASIGSASTQAYTSVITWSDGSTSDGTSTLSLVSSNPSAATVSGQTATGVSSGSTNITGSNAGVSCSPVSALTVTGAQPPKSKMTANTISTRNTSMQ